MSTRRTQMVAAALAIWALCLWLVPHLFSQIGTAAKPLPAASTTLMNGIVSPATAAALQVDTTQAAPLFRSDFENPFRPLSAPLGELPQPGGVTSNASGGVSESSRSLTLKGVLVREKPQAIIEDGTGRTFICGEGEMLGEARIVEITGDLVRLKDKRGTFVLTVGD